MTDKNKTQKERTAVWFTPDFVPEIDSWVKGDNCKNRSEFIEKAVRFYIGYLNGNNTADYLSKALVPEIRAVINSGFERNSAWNFKTAVMVDMLCHIVAAYFGNTVGNVDELRRYAMEEVKRTNGIAEYDDILKYEKGGGS